MLHFRNLLTVLGLSILLLSCKKEDTPDNNNGTRGFTPQPQTNTLRALFVTSIERDTPFGTRYLTVFEPNGTVRWKKALKGLPFYNGNISYGNGMIYSTEAVTNTTNGLYAYDINTGFVVWSIISSSEKKYYPVLRNDTLFCSTSFSYPGLGNVAAFNARTGDLLWRKQLPYPYWPVYLTVDGNTLFFIVTLSGTDSRVVSFNLSTRTVNWESSTLGINIVSTFSEIAVSPSRVAVTNGTKLLIVFDRNTGAVISTKPGIPFEPPIIDDNKIFTHCPRDVNYPVSHDSLLGLYAFDANTGNQLWKWKRPILLSNSSPFVSGNMIFHSGMDADAVTAPPKGYIKGFDLATGTEIWNVATGLTFDQICRGVACVGNEVYAMKYPPLGGGPGLYGKIVKYDYSTGHAKDSISIPMVTFEEMFLVASDGKVYSPHLRN